MKPKRVVLVSGHYLQSQRRAGFHWLAQAYHRLGWHVTFVTVGLSWLSALRRDHRMAYPVRAQAHRLVEVAPGLESFVWFTPWHPANLRFAVLNRLASPCYRRYARFALGTLTSRIEQAELIVLESGPGLLLVERLRQLNRDARLVYRVSDDLEVLAYHPVVREAERGFVDWFDVVSVVSEPMLRRFGGRANVRLDPHRIARELFDAPSASPYTDATGVNAVWVGTERLDPGFLRVASAARPDWRFHIIGPVRDVPRRANVIAYGEMPFEQTVAYVKHADVGLHPLPARPGLAVFRDSLKMQQYTYCRLPVVAPSFIAGDDRPHVCGYEPNDPDSIRAALDAAERFDRARIAPAARAVGSWADLALTLAGEPAPSVEDASAIT